MSDCSKCGHQNPEGTDFCVSCGNYLRWQPTALHPVPTETDEADMRRTVVDPGAVRVTLRATSLADPDDGPSSTRVMPGERTSVTAVVRNQDTIVDTYELRVVGLPETWWSVTPPSIHLLPYGSNETGYEQAVTVSLHPPRVPESEARSWPFRLVAASGARVGLSGEASGTLIVERYDELSCTLRPERRSGISPADYEVIVRNGGNAATAVVLSGSDPEELLRFRFVPAQLQLALGEEWALELRVEADLPGRERELRFGIQATSDRTSAASTGVFVQQLPARRRGWLTVLRIALTLLAVLVLVVSLLKAHPPPPLGMTMALGIAALAGLRRGRRTLIAGFLALFVLLVLVAIKGGGFLAAAFFAAVLAFAAGFLRVLEGDGG